METQALGLNEIQNRCEKTAKKFWNKALGLYPKLAGYKMPSVVINSRLRTTAGYSYSGKENRIEFNPHLYLRHEDIFHLDTIPHELAHNIADRLFKSKGHDEAWHNTFFDLTGYLAERTHSMNVKHLEIKQKTYEYKCDCQTWKFSGRRNSLHKKGHRYFCKECGATIFPMKG